MEPCSTDWQRPWPSQSWERDSTLKVDTWFAGDRYPTMSAWGAHWRWRALTPTGRHTRLRLSLYTDDAIIFVSKKQEEVATLMSIMDNLGKSNMPSNKYWEGTGTSCPLLLTYIFSHGPQRKWTRDEAPFEIRPLKYGGLGIHWNVSAECYDWRGFGMAGHNHNAHGMDLPVDNVDRKLFTAATRVTIRNGKKASFWSPKWLQATSPANLFPTLYKHNRCKNRTVHSCFLNYHP
jgi:hypothetical protein